MEAAGGVGDRPAVIGPHHEHLVPHHPQAATGGRLAEIVSATGQSVRQITVSVSQQDAGTRQIAEAIGGLSEQMRRTLAALEQTEAVTDSVQKLAEAMAGLASDAR